MPNLLVPGGIPVGSPLLVIPASGAADALVWPYKRPGDVLSRGIDARPCLAALDPVARLDGLPVLAADPSLTVSLVDASPEGLLWLLIGGGVALASPLVSVGLPLSGGRRLLIEVVQVIGPDAAAGLVPVAAAPANALTQGGITLTVDGAPLLLGP